MLEISSKEFNNYISQPCVIDFYTSSCPSCEKFLPIFEESESKYENIEFIKINLEDDLGLAERFNISHIPTIIKFDNSEIVSQHTGFMSSEEFDEFMSK